jgi:hypothetical protein
MPYPPTCCQCTTKTFILWDGKPWCREHFLAATERAEHERTTAEAPLTDRRI